MKYGQFCPVAKATEILGERWTFLIVRELLMGGRRFSELQRGLGDISPALLTARLKFFEEQGLVARRRLNGQRSFEYHPTAACEALLPVLMSVGEWGLTWARHNLSEQDFDLDFLLYYLERSVDPAMLPGDHAVLQFKFHDLTGQKDWWILVDHGEVDVCVTCPGRDFVIAVGFRQRNTSPAVKPQAGSQLRDYCKGVTPADLILQSRRVSLKAGGNTCVRA